MNKLTLPIQIGHKYVRRDGAVITALAPHPAYERGGSRFVYVGNEPKAPMIPAQHAWVESGAIHRDTTDSLDLVADYIEPVVGHPHAALMALYAQDASETTEPWLRWERTLHPKTNTDVSWQTRQTHPGWLEDYAYRRKLKTIRIGEFDVPEPIRERPDDRTPLFVACLTGIDNLVFTFNYNIGITGNVEWFKRGLLHTTRKAAELHAKALLSLTEVKA